VAAAVAEYERLRAAGRITGPTIHDPSEFRGGTTTTITRGPDGERYVKTKLHMPTTVRAYGAPIDAAAALWDPIKQEEMRRARAAMPVPATMQVHPTMDIKVQAGRRPDDNTEALARARQRARQRAGKVTYVPTRPSSTVKT
jgi:hypothetical protein